MFTGLVSVAVIVAVLGSLVRIPKRKDLVWLSLGLVAGVFAQAVLGGLTVLFDLKPGFVMAHFLLSIVLLTERARARAPRRSTRRARARGRHARTVILGRVLLGLGGRGTGHRHGRDRRGAAQRWRQARRRLAPRPSDPRRRARARDDGDDLPRRGARDGVARCDAIARRATCSRGSRCFSSYSSRRPPSATCSTSTTSPRCSSACTSPVRPRCGARPSRSTWGCSNARRSRRPTA